MNNLLKLNELNIKLNAKNKFIVKDIHLNINIEKATIGYINIIVVKESSYENTLEAYLDQLESNSINANQLNYLKLIDAGYGTKLPSGDLIYIDEIYIEESYRGKKYGTAVLEELISYAKNIGINRLVLTPQPIGLNKSHESFNNKVLELELWYKKYDFKTYSSKNDNFKYMLKILN